jgi:rhodanese-related sulfurtransferase
MQNQIDGSNMGSPFSPVAEGNNMAKAFYQMAEEVMAEVPVINAEEAHRRIEEDPEMLVIDPRDAADVAATGMIADAMNISYGALTYQTDNELPEDWRNPVFENRSRPIITACEMGPLRALAGMLLKDMGFTNVSILDGGLDAWKEAGYPTN